jgi:hypothetical protein
MNQLLQSGTKKEILDAIEVALKNSSESPFWAEKVLPFSQAVLSTLLALREQNLLFSPEGKPEDKLNIELFLNWCDLYSLRFLAFSLQKSNESKELRDTKYDSLTCKAYQEVDLQELGSYLSSYKVDLENMMVDFPITNYNLHVGIHGVLKKLLK